MTTRQNSIWFHVFDVLLNIVVIVAIVVAIRIFLVSPFQVEGASMMSTLEDGQYIIINKLAYHLGTPERGDIVVFRPPNDPSNHYVKRVIGTPGDTIVIRDGYVYVQPDGATELTKLSEPYLNDNNLGHTYNQPGRTDSHVYDIPDGHYFLLGDNRQASLDSRAFRPTAYVEEDSIKGRVWFIALPISKIHALEPTEYAL